MVITSTIYSDNYHNIPTNHIKYDEFIASIIRLENMEVQVYNFQDVSFLKQLVGKFNWDGLQWNSWSMVCKGWLFNLFHFHIEMTWLHSIDQKLQG